MPYPDKQAIFSRIKELLLHYVFSFKGFANGLQFGIATSIAFISNDILSKLDVSLTIRNFIYGYIMLVAFQKRCRDINIKGTLIIIFITLAFFYVAIFEALKLDMYGYLDTTSKFFLHAYAFLVDQPVVKIPVFIRVSVYWHMPLGYIRGIRTSR